MEGTPSIVCPFTVIVDTREQAGYSFTGLHEGTGPRRRQLIVPTIRAALDVADYSVLGLPQVLIERKSKSDLFGSVSRRANFEGRLARMSERQYAAVVVEASWHEILSDPPRHSKIHPRSLARTLIAWDCRYPVKWHLMPGRDAAEAMTFRLLERFYKDHRVTHDHDHDITPDLTPLNTLDVST